MKSNMSLLLFVTLTLISLSGCGGSEGSGYSNINLPIGTDYQTLLESTVNDDVPGAILHIESPTETFIGSAGYANVSSLEQMQTYHQMPVGSAGKKVTALLVSLLHTQGVLDIDDTIDTWLPESLLNQIQFSEAITLRMLLNHTAGVYDYLDSNTSGDWFESIMNDPTSLKSDEYALQFALSQPAYHYPGEAFKYSNTGYLLAGIILDTVLGEQHHLEVRSQILDPLNLANTYSTAYEKQMGDIISGYFVLDGETLDTKEAYENIGVSDAPISSTVEDMSTLLRAIVTDDSVLNEEIRTLMFGEENLNDIGNEVYYGMGIFKDIIQGYTVYHHGGDEPGYKTVNIYIVETDTAVSAFFNCNLYEPCMGRTDAMIQEVLASLLQ